MSATSKRNIVFTFLLIAMAAATYFLLTLVGTWNVFTIIISAVISAIILLLFEFHTKAFRIGFFIGLFLVALTHDIYNKEGSIFINSDGSLYQEEIISAIYINILPEGSRQIKHVKSSVSFKFEIREGLVILRTDSVRVYYAWEVNFAAAHFKNDVKIFTRKILEGYIEKNYLSATPDDVQKEACRWLTDNNYTFETCPITIHI